MFIGESLKKYVAQKSGLAQDAFSLFVSERSDFGEFSTNAAFVMAQARATSPFLVAEDLRQELVQDKEFCSFVERIEVKNGYVNFFLAREYVSRALRDSVKKEKPEHPATVLVEYSSPNIGKPLSIAHIRSTIIGDALARMYGFLGYRVITDSHVGDWGMLAGKLIAAYKLFARKSVSKLTIQDMQELYVHFTTYEKDKPEYTDMARQETVKLQHEDKESMRIWKTLSRNSMKEFNRMYKLLGILKFTYQHGESYYRKLAEALVPDFAQKGYAHESQGALMIDLDDAGLPPVMIQKSDEGFLYATSDFATVMERTTSVKADLVLYVVANEQALHFEQVFAVAKKYELSGNTKLVHVKFGMILGQDKKKLSTRRGKSILLEDVLEEGMKKARALAMKKNESLSDAQAALIAHRIGIGAIKYNDLSQNRNTDIVFDWDKMLALDGNSAPYIQYAYARLMSILRKAGGRPHPLSAKHLALLEKEEWELAKHCALLKDSVQKAVQENLPNILANFVYAISMRANAWYEKYPVLKSEGTVRSARLSLAQTVCAILEQGLDLLGISVLPEI